MRRRVRSVRTWLAVISGGVFAAGGFLVLGAAPASATSVSTEAQLRAAFAADTVIDVQADITLTDCTGGGDVARLAGVTDPITINGHGHTIRQTCPQRVFFQGGSGLMTVNDLTITGGNSPVGASGGGILSSSPLTILDTTIVSNRAGGAGGGIASDGVTTISGSTIDSNISSGVGGGISLGPDAHDLTVTNSTVSRNVGGGIGTPASDPDASVTVINSTITQNTNGPSSLGSGIFSSAATTLVYSSLVNNTADHFSNLDTATLQSFGSVITGGGPAAMNCLVGTPDSHGYNFSDDDTCGFTNATDRQNAGDPQLGPLANNGGATQTLLPEPESPLIDAIPPGACQSDGASGITTDQRGITRPQGPGCDVGAVEVAVPVAPLPIIVVPRFTG